MRHWQAIITVWLGVCVGCGTSRWSDSTRTATEQLLISGAIERAVSDIDFCSLAGKKVYFDTTSLRTTIDADYIASSLRQHALASGCIVKWKAEDADYICEVRAGTVGTDRHDVLFGIPATSLPTSTSGSTTTIPEIPLVKKTDQRAVAKLAIFAYNRYTGRPVWQSGTRPYELKTKDVWVFGTGPFQKGDIHKSVKFAGEKIPIPVLDPGAKSESLGEVSVTSQAYFNEPKEALELAKREAMERAASESSSPPAQSNTGPGSPTSLTSTMFSSQIGLSPPAGNATSSVQTQGNGFTNPATSTSGSTTSGTKTIQIQEWPFGRK